MSGKLSPECEPSTCSTKEINDLPDEVISYILEFLPFTYLQDARLVCQRWYRASLSPSLLNQGKVVCLESEGDLLPNSLMKSKLISRNFCFKGDIPDVYGNISWSNWFQLYDDIFWAYYGPHIRSLSFRKCEIIKEHFLKVLSQCPKLKSLEITECGCTSPREEEEITLDDKHMPKLFHLENLTIDNTSGGYFDFKGNLFDTVLCSVSNLKSLHLVNCMKEEGIFGTVYLTPEHVIYYIQKHAQSIVNISFIHKEVHGNERALNDLLKIPNLRLHSLETNYQIPKDLANSLQTLQCLKLRGITRGGLMEEILIELKNLTCLEIDNYYPAKTLSNFNFFENLYSLCLGVYFTNRDKDPNVMILRGLCSKKNTTLKKLSLRLDRGWDLETKTVEAIVEAHPALTDLELEWCMVDSWDITIQSVLNWQVSLRSLQLTHTPSFPDHFFPPLRSIEECLEQHPEAAGTRRYTLSGLKNLWRLDLENEVHCYKRSLFKDLILPELRELSLSQFHQIPDQCLAFFLKNHPKIEKLSLNRVLFGDEVVDVIFSSLPRLKYVYIENVGEPSSEESIQKFRQRCKTEFDARTKVRRQGEVYRYAINAREFSNKPPI